jgi:hypothetical protein
MSDDLEEIERLASADTASPGRAKMILFLIEELREARRLLRDAEPLVKAHAMAHPNDVSVAFHRKVRRVIGNER